ncbi:MAG: response regulator transcription factor [Muribaculaceae bacterium]|nr:response regulator transcription factor [Muribaculaceae bacterium]
MSSKKLLVVDDHPVVLEGLESVLSGQGYDVLKAGSEKEALAVAEANADIEILVIDLTLKKDADGLDLLKKIRVTKPRVPAVVYTMHEEMWNISTLMDSEVEGIVLKGEKIDELLEAVRLVGKGAVYRSPEFRERFDSVRKARGILSQTDMDVLRLISQGMSSGIISKKVNLTEKAVEYHRGNIIKKLGAKNMTEAIRNAVKLGIISCLVGFAAHPSLAADDVPRAVDLGLSVKWADRNVGADAPLAAGGYFSFGETKEKTDYDWPTYTLCEEGNMSKQLYIGDGSISGTDYDAATASLGKDWQIPSYEEVEELLESCQAEMLEEDGRKYWRFTGPSGAYVDFPVVGYMSRQRVLRDNEESPMWIGSFEYLEEEDGGEVFRMNDSYSLTLSTIAPMVLETSPHLGLQIRPVYVGTTDIQEVSSDTDRRLEAVYTVDGRRVYADSDCLPSGVYIYRYSDGTSTRRLH